MLLLSCLRSYPKFPEWSANDPLTVGPFKDAFVGTYRGKKVDISIAKKRGEERLLVEIQTLKQLGKHPNFVHIVFSDSTRDLPYMALEHTQPLGFNLDRVVKQYQFAKQTVPIQ